MVATMPSLPHADLELYDRHIGTKLRERRQQLRLPQRALAAQMDITYQQIQKYESGVNRLSGARLLQLAEILKVSLGYFYFGAPSTLQTGEQHPWSPNQWQEQLERLTPQQRDALQGMVLALDK